MTALDRIRLIGITPGDQGYTPPAGAGGGVVGRDLVRLVEAAASAGLRMAILREPELPERPYVALARRLAQVLGDGVVLHGKHPSALHLAEAGGWSLHLPADADARAARPRVRGLLGQSCHSAQDVARAREAGCDYAIVSPIFPPRSKPNDTRPPLGVDGLKAICRGANLPVVALGGIDPDRARACLGAGAMAVAATGALFPPDASPEEVEALTRAMVSATG